MLKSIATGIKAPVIALRFILLLLLLEVRALRDSEADSILILDSRFKLSRF